MRYREIERLDTAMKNRMDLLFYVGVASMKLDNSYSELVQKSLLAPGID